MKSKGAFALVLTVLSLMTSSPPLLQAASSSARVQVSTEIQPWLAFDIVQNVHSYVVTMEDLKRGYVDVAGSATIRVNTNVMQSILVHVMNQGPEPIHVKDSSSSNFTLSSAQLNLGRQKPGVAMSEDLDCRILLAEGTRQGVYPLLLAISLQTD